MTSGTAGSSKRIGESAITPYDRGLPDPRARRQLQPLVLPQPSQT